MQRKKCWARICFSVHRIYQPSDNVSVTSHHGPAILQAIRGAGAETTNPQSARMGMTPISRGTKRPWSLMRNEATSRASPDNFEDAWLQAAAAAAVSASKPS
mmetsp:Transcript_6532/g.13640  ORF Transcript_6532/g.13640 Transcript_6532/m.13640 type:complete len:102 (-) Transcript_6532:754-1059(-)